MIEIKQKSVIPIYSTGLVWLIYSLIFPLYEYLHLLIAAALSIAVYFILSAIIPKKTVMVKEEVQKTGIAQVDALITKGQSYITELERLDCEINNVKISGDITKITSSSGRLFEFITKNPDLSGRLKTFMDYYFPTLINLLSSYADLEAQPSAGSNISGAINKIENIMDTIVNAFDKQLDNMYSDKALDISADIEVLKNIIQSEGLD